MKRRRMMRRIRIRIRNKTVPSRRDEG